MVIETFKIVNDFAPSHLSNIFEMSQIHMICVAKVDLFSPKWTQHKMDWKRLSNMDPIFEIYVRRFGFSQPKQTYRKWNIFKSVH